MLNKHIPHENKKQNKEHEPQKPFAECEASISSPKFGNFFLRTLQQGRQKSLVSSLNLSASNKLVQVTVIEANKMK